ncbi:MAG: GxxExxY protein [Ferruginibacter sp.]
MSEIIYREESYTIIGKCMEIHNQLGHGFSEIVYKDALQMEFEESLILFEREKEYRVYYKGQLLEHRFYADFVAYDNIILEIKCVKTLTDEHVSQCINYLKVSNNKLALLINFARGKLEYQRILYS